MMYVMFRVSHGCGLLCRTEMNPFVHVRLSSFNNKQHIPYQFIRTFSTIRRAQTIFAAPFPWILTAAKLHTEEHVLRIFYEIEAVMADRTVRYNTAKLLYVASSASPVETSTPCCSR